MFEMELYDVVKKKLVKEISKPVEEVLDKHGYLYTEKLAKEIAEKVVEELMK